MGNQATHLHQAAQQQQSAVPPAAGAEPLESFAKEKQRDEHLKNLGFKRSKSLRRSISKKLRKVNKRKRDSNDDVPDGGDAVPDGPKESQESHKSQCGSKESNKERVPSIEKLDRADVPEAERRPRPAVGEPQPLPSHVADLEERPRRMDKLRRSLRSSLRRKKDHSRRHDSGGGGTGGGTGGGSGGGGGGDGERGQNRQGERGSSSSRGGGSAGAGGSQWQMDEVSVRSGTCSFQVKYLGCVEVFESRGMQVCEEAIKVLKNSKRKSVRAVLYVHGDGLRVVDDETKGLIVDQTIEKVSFCAPDRNYERGFTYICRDGTTRRWMCHGFMANRESGERLSHAVGCAFAICLEKKQERDRLNVTMSFNKDDSTFTRFGSFRQGTITERLQDPQSLKPSATPPPLPSAGESGADLKEENPFAIARPHAKVDPLSLSLSSADMFRRQTSFKGFNELQAQQGNSPFKRQFSLRLTELPSTLERQQMSAALQPESSSSSGILADVDPMLAKLGLVGPESAQQPPTLKSTPNSVMSLKNQLNQLYQISEEQQRAHVNPFLLQPDKFDAIEEEEDEAEKNAEPPAADPIDSMCQQLSQELSLTAANVAVAVASPPSDSTVNNNSSPQQSQSLPYIPLGATASSSSQPSKELSSSEQQPSANFEFPALSDTFTFPESCGKAVGKLWEIPEMPSSSTMNNGAPMMVSSAVRSSSSRSSSSSSSSPPLSSDSPASAQSKREETIGMEGESVKPVQHTNPWDFVPDQPKQNLLGDPALSAPFSAAAPTALAPSSAAAVANHCDSSSGVSSTGSNAFNFAASSSSSALFANGGADDWFNNADGKKPSSGGFETSFDLSNKLNGSSVSGGGDFDVNNGVGAEVAEPSRILDDSSRILDDPFDAEWAALATRNNTKNTNPFKNGDGGAAVGDSGGGERDFKTFELQM